MEKYFEPGPFNPSLAYTYMRGGALLLGFGAVGNARMLVLVEKYCEPVPQIILKGISWPNKYLTLLRSVRRVRNRP